MSVTRTENNSCSLRETLLSRLPETRRQEVLRHCAKSTEDYWRGKTGSSSEVTRQPEPEANNKVRQRGSETVSAGNWQLSDDRPDAPISPIPHQDTTRMLPFLES